MTQMNKTQSNADFGINLLLSEGLTCSGHGPVKPPLSFEICDLIEINGRMVFGFGNFKNGDQFE